MEKFPAYLMTAPGEGSVVDLTEEQLPNRSFRVKVEYSSLNYKDALAITGKAPVLKEYPMVPGIDLVGTILESKFNMLSAVGEHLVATGNGTGEKNSGGLAGIAHIRSAGITQLPKRLTSRQAAALGTAGLTAALCAMSILEKYPDFRDMKNVLVTGATGGVGSIAVMLFSALGYRVVAATGRPEYEGYLKNLGATEVVSRDDISSGEGPLQRGKRWSAVVDTVGGDTLSSALRAVADEGIVTACGMAGGAKLHTTVYPFILRGITLRGINSVDVSTEKRWRAWEMLSTYIDRDKLDEITQEITLSQLPEYAAKMLNNQTHGRIVVRPER